MSSLHIERFISLGSANFIDLYAVPAGKLLEVKYVYLSASVGEPGDARGSLGGGISLAATLTP